VTQTTRPKLSREVIIEAAMRLVDQHGVGWLSMRKLGAELGVEVMTLYYYLANKNAVLDGLVDHVLAKVRFDAVGPAAHWPDWLRGFAFSFRQALMSHPGVLPLVAAQQFDGHRVIDAVLAAKAALTSAGFSPQRASHVLSAVATLVLGHAQPKSPPPPPNPAKENNHRNRSAAATPTTPASPSPSTP